MEIRGPGLGEQKRRVAKGIGKCGDYENSVAISFEFHCPRKGSAVVSNKTQERDVLTYTIVMSLVFDAVKQLPSM
jgi:hypothetical protein